MSERCLQEIMGSCAGCEIRDNLLPKRMRVLGEAQSRAEIAKRVESDWCPDGARLQLPQEQRPEIWKPGLLLRNVFENLSVVEPRRANVVSEVRS